MKTLYVSLFIFFTCCLTAQVSLSNSLTACYSLDGNANDPINSLTGTLSAVTPTVNRFSQPNSAMAFNGTISSYIQLPNNPLIKPTAVSFSGWVKSNITNTHQYIVYTNNTCGSYYEGYTLLYYNIGPNAYRFSVVKSTTPCSSASQAVVYGSTTSITANTWYHVGFYIGSDSLKLYVNGVLDGAIANTNPIVYNPVKGVFLGGTNEIANFPLNGTIDNVRFYNRKLSGTEFNQLYTLDPVCQPMPVATFSTSSNNVCVNQTISLTSLATNTPTSWSWQMTGGTPSVSSVANPTVTYTTPGTYTISHTATNSFGTSTPVMQTVTVSACTFINKNVLNNEILLYPNPNKGELYVSGLEIGTSIKVYNSLGALVYWGIAESEKEKINLTTQNPGLYIVKFISGSKSFTSKIIRE